MLLIMVLELCIKNPSSIVKYIQPTTGMLRTNLKLVMEEILEDCPLHLRPEFKTQDNLYVFKNGSIIQLAGTDNGNYNKLRGGNTHLAVVDEAGFCSDLNIIKSSILVPTTTLTRGRIIFSSTTPPHPDHEFIKIMEEADKKSGLIKKTIIDAMHDSETEKNPRISKEIVADIIKEYSKGAESDEFRTEYMCEIIHNSDDSVIPEFTPEIQKETIREWPRPLFYDRYVAMDIGFDDLTAVLFAYWDFDNGVLVIEDEYSINGPQMTTPVLAEAIMQKEKRLWTNKVTGEFQDPYLRVSDNNLILINDLQQLHHLTFQPTEKKNKDAHINNLRTMVGNCQVAINPRCEGLIRHMKYATWNKARDDFKKSSDNGHYDFVAALMYLARNIQKSKNPYPTGYRYSKLGNPSDVFIRKEDESDFNEQYEKLNALFKIKSSMTQFNQKNTKAEKTPALTYLGGNKNKRR
jgi:phage FluMu gp28-like protein